MGIYSHSKLSTFDQCKYKFKLNYIDRIKTGVQSVEAFMGSLVHDALEKLYRDLQVNRINSKDDLLRYYLRRWDESWKDDILIVKEYGTQDLYKNMGVEFILNYYDQYHPFDQLKIIGVETNEKLDLENGNKYYVKIDRLAADGEGNYYVIDYKTGGSKKQQIDLDRDRQLAMYSIWVREKYPEAKDVKLVWNFLAFNEELTSNRSEAELRFLKEEVEKKIKEIENCKEYPTTVTKLCDYCEYRSICPEWGEKKIVGKGIKKQTLLNDFFA